MNELEELIEKTRRQKKKRGKFDDEPSGITFFLMTGAVGFLFMTAFIEGPMRFFTFGLGLLMFAPVLFIALYQMWEELKNVCNSSTGRG